MKLNADNNCILIRLMWSDRARGGAGQCGSNEGMAAPEPLTPTLKANNLACAANLLEINTVAPVTAACPAAA